MCFRQRLRLMYFSLRQKIAVSARSEATKIFGISSNGQIVIMAVTMRLSERYLSKELGGQKNMSIYWVWRRIEQGTSQSLQWFSQDQIVQYNEIQTKRSLQPSEQKKGAQLYFFFSLLSEIIFHASLFSFPSNLIYLFSSLSPYHLFSQLQTFLIFFSKASQFPQSKSYFYNRRMNQTSSSLHLQKLISKLKLQQPVIRKSETKATNFAKYNKPILQHSYRSCRNTRVEKFKKHSNLVQVNKENVVRLHTSKPNREYLNAPTIESYKNTARLPPRKTTLLTSGSQEGIQVNPDNLETLLRKNSMKTNRNLLGLNILQLEKKFNISRFQLYSLHSAYKTLLLDSRQSLGRFRGSFEVMLNMNKIIIRPQELQRIFRQQGLISFQAFISMYGKIDRAIVKESIVDYVRILFDGVFDKDRIRFQDIIRLLKTRITDKQAFDIAKIIFQQNEKDFDDFIALTEILELCQSCENFSKKMYRLYTREAKLD